VAADTMEVTMEEDTTMCPSSHHSSLLLDPQAWAALDPPS
jgi:hypothetical protein